MSKHIIDGLTVAGLVGSAITLLDRALCIAQATHEASGPTFTNRSAEARTEGGTAYTVVGATTDRFYFGYDAKFPGIRVDLDVAGAGLALVWEYWNGSAWTALSGVAGAASGLTADGAVTWTVPGGWAKTTVDSGASLFFVRVRTTTLTTAPTAFFTVVNWTIFDDIAGTNAKVYKSIGEDGASSILWHVNDNAPITDAKGFGTRLYETWDAVAHTGTAETPTVAQAANGDYVRKSVSADATARTTLLLVSRDLCIWSCLTGDTAGIYSSSYIGKFSSYVAGDAFNLMLATGAVTAVTSAGMLATSGSPLANVTGCYVQRAYPGSGGSVQLGLFGSLGITTTPYAELPTYPNGPNGGLLIGPIRLTEGAAGGHVRGECLSLVAIYHKAAATLVNGDLFTDPATGKQYWVIRSGLGSAAQTAVWAGVEVPA